MKWENCFLQHIKNLNSPATTDTREELRVWFYDIIENVASEIEVDKSLVRVETGLALITFVLHQVYELSPPDSAAQLKI